MSSSGPHELNWHGKREVLVQYSRLTHREALVIVTCSPQNRLLCKDAVCIHLDWLKVPQGLTVLHIIQNQV